LDPWFLGAAVVPCGYRRVAPAGRVKARRGRRKPAVILMGRKDMKLKLLALRLDPAAGVFDDTALADFQEGREIIDVSDYLFNYEGLPTLALLIRYRDIEEDFLRPTTDQNTRKDWRSDLGPDERNLYDALRNWRLDRSSRDGLPKYMVLTNRQMAAIATTRPSSLTDLHGIAGIGDAKVGSYGEDILALVKASLISENRVPQS